MSDSSDKIVSVFLKFGADPQAIEASIASFEKIQVELQSLEKEAKTLEGQISTALAHGEDAGQLTGELKTVEAAIDNLSRKASSELGAGLNSSFEQVGRAAQRSGASIGQSFNLRDIGEKLNFVGMAMSSAGQGITNSLMGAVNAYLAASGQYSSEARRWDAAQKEMQAAYTRIGAVALDKLTPYIEKAADLLDKLAGFIEQNPELVKAAAGTGVMLTIGGKFVSAVAQLAMIAGSFQGLSKLAGADKLIEGASAASGTALQGGVYGAAVIGGGLIGKGLGNAINSALGQKEQSWGDIAHTAQEISALASPLNVVSAGLRAAGFKDQADTIWDFVKSMNGLGEAAEDTGMKVQKSGTSIFASQNVQAYIDFEKQRAEAASQHAEQIKQAEAEAEKRRLEIIDNFAKQAARVEINYQRENARAEKSFVEANAQAEQDYYKQRTEAEANFNLELQRMAQDHQRELQRLQEEHDGRVTDLVAARDALGLVKENEAYQKQRQQAESDYNLEVSRKRQDQARQMAEMEANYQAQRAQRAHENASQQAERVQQHAQEMADLQKEKADQLSILDKATKEQFSELETTYKKQSDLMQTAFIDRLNVMSKSIMGDTAAFEKYMQDQSARFEEFLKSKGYISSTAGTPETPVGQKAGGGAVLDGLTYLVGERGPELFTAPRNGSIIPAGLTAAMLNPRSQSAAHNMTLKIESSSLSLTEILNEVDQRFKRFERGLEGAFSE